MRRLTTVTVALYVDNCRMRRHMHVCFLGAFKAQPLQAIRMQYRLFRDSLLTSAILGKVVEKSAATFDLKE